MVSCTEDRFACAGACFVGGGSCEGGLTARSTLFDVALGTVDKFTDLDCPVRVGGSSVSSEIACRM